MSDTNAGLVAERLDAGYGSVGVLRQVDLRAAPGEVVAVLGHNGAGKSTLLKALFGLLPLTAGSVRLDGAEMGGLGSHERVRRGLSYSPQQHFVFSGLTVRENLHLAQFTVNDREAIAARRTEVFELFPMLADRLAQRAGTLSGGQQRMLSIGMALLTEPTVMLLDEPSLGVAPTVISDMMAALRRLAETKRIAVVLVEQNVKQAAEVADRVCVLRRGEVVHDGPADASLVDRDDLWTLL